MVVPVAGVVLTTLKLATVPFVNGLVDSIGVPGVDNNLGLVKPVFASGI